VILYRPGPRFVAQPCEQIFGSRNRIIHGYADVDHDIVWAIVQNEVPRLLEKSESLLKEKP
jgi:uncharacterized protein with HEPN domain